MTKKLIKNLIKLSIVGIIIGGVYMLYFFTVGVPKTQARNYYNKALIEIENGDNEKALEYLNNGQSYWREDYIKEEIEKLERTNV